MSVITVREILTLSPLAGTYVLAGAAGLDRPVTGVNVMEVPDIESYVKQGEVLLTTAYPVRDRPERLVELVPELAARGLAALAIKPMRYLERLPDRLVEVADELDFPVLIVPDDTSFNEVIGAVLAVVLADYGADPARAEAIRERLTGVALSGGGLEEIARTLAGALDRPVSVLDDDGVVLGGRREEPARRDTHDGSEVSVTVEGPGDPEVWRFPISVAGVRRGEVVVAGETEPTLGQRRLIRQACFAAGMFLAQALASIELDRRLRVLFLEELITGPRMDEAALVQRGRLFGWQLDGPRCVLVASCTNELSEPAVAAAAPTALGEDALAWCRGRRVIAIARAGGTDRADTPLEHRWQTELLRHGAGAVTVASGSVAASPAGLTHSHDTAQESLRIGQMTGRVAVSHADLAFERLLLAAPQAQARSFVDQQIGALVQHDAKTGSDLTHTLGVFLGLGNAAEAARRLYVHYNTMKHRLQRVSELTGADLADPRTRIVLAVALEVSGLLKDLEGANAASNE